MPKSIRAIRHASPEVADELRAQSLSILGATALLGISISLAAPPIILTVISGSAVSYFLSVFALAVGEEYKKDATDASIMETWKNAAGQEFTTSALTHKILAKAEKTIDKILGSDEITPRKWAEAKKYAALFSRTAGLTKANDGKDFQWARLVGGKPQTLHFN